MDWKAFLALLMGIIARLVTMGLIAIVGMDAARAEMKGAEIAQFVGAVLAFVLLVAWAYKSCKKLLNTLPPQTGQELQKIYDTTYEAMKLAESGDQLAARRKLYEAQNITAFIKPPPPPLVRSN